MGHYKKHTAIHLPQSILEEIHQQDGLSAALMSNLSLLKLNPFAGQEAKHRGSSKKTRSLNRKETRKKGRIEQKQKKAHYFTTGRKRRPDDEVPEDSESPQRKRARTGDSVEGGNFQVRVEKNRKETQSKPTKEQESPAHKKKPTKDDRHSEEKKKKSEKDTRSVPPLKGQIEEEEDAYITYLEKKLGYTRGESKRKQDSIEEDGLDGEPRYYPTPLQKLTSRFNRSFKMGRFFQNGAPQRDTLALSFNCRLG